MFAFRRVIRLLTAVSLFVVVRQAQAATYLPLTDYDLARRSPEIVRAKVVDRLVSSERIDGKDLPFTTVQLHAEEVLKGSVPEFFSLRLPGGTAGDITWLIPGTPSFKSDQEVILFIHPLGKAGTYGLTEFGLSKFEVMEDAIGQRYAVRSVFDSATDDSLSGRPVTETAAEGDAAYRDAISFLDALRIQPEARPATIHYGKPHGPLRDPKFGVRPEWVNIGGREPGVCSDGSACLFRWFWDTGASPIGTVSTTGAQTNLTDGSNGLQHVQNAISKWSSVAAADVRYTATSGTGNVVVHLDVVNPQRGYWSDSSDTGAIACGAGVIGLGGPQSARGPYSFKNEGQFFAVTGAEVWMRRSICSSRYDAATFRTAVLHELGHTLGLGHPDQEQSVHSTTLSSSWNAAVMRSAVSAARPDTPQFDDVQAIQYYYPATAQPPPPPPPPPSGCIASSTALCLNGRFRAEVSRGRGRGSNAAAVALSVDTGYFWFFSSSNVEVVVKVVDGRAVNQSRWVFYAGLSDVDYSLTVTDTATGAVKVYTNPQGTVASVADTSAFPEGRGRNGAVRSETSPESADLSESGKVAQSRSLARQARVSSSSACSPGGGVLCLNSSRFRVEVSWGTATSSGTSQAVTVTSDTGYFWFFSPSNVEIVIKVVDGRAFNNRFWVFYGALSDVQYTITVTDTLTGALRTYANAQGHLTSVADTSAF